MTTRRSDARSGHPSTRGARRHHLPTDGRTTRHDGAVGVPATVRSRPVGPAASDLGDEILFPGRRTSGRDPFLTRVGVLVLAGVLLAPIVAAFGEDGTEMVTAGAGGATAMVGPIQAVTSDDSSSTGEPSTSATSVTTDAASASTETNRSRRSVTRSAAAPATAPATTAAPATVPVARQPASRAVSAPVAVACSGRYTARRGDYWIGIADRADVELRSLLRANAATVNTPLFPGDRVCLPPGARQPGPPPTTPAPSPARPGPPAARPTPTTPPTTQPPASRPPSSYGRDEVLAIIREVWPDHLEERAIQIAWRESNWIPTARNYCCHGLFQIYFSVHRGWLGWFGVTSAEHLWDPRTNALAAYYLYTRAGGWGPWGG